MTNPSPKPTNYAQSGVDTDRQELGLARIIKHVRSTWTHQGIGAVALDIGQFANIIEIGNGQGICVATDGVGSKAMVALMMERYDTIGIDCVAMNVNDVICVGATALTMVDYIAIRHPDPDLLGDLGAGLAEGARQANISISGGEIAQLPDMLSAHRDGNSFDLVGTATGLVDLDKIIIGRDIQAGDCLIGVQSSGIHSNGLSLARRVLFEDNGLDIDAHLPDLGRSLGDELLRPTYIYAREVQEILDRHLTIKAMVHITGDGLLNLNRVAAPVGFVIDDAPAIPPIFDLIQRLGNVHPAEMYRVFNMGIGFCMVVAPKDVNLVCDIVRSHGKEAAIIGYAVADEKRRVFLPKQKLVGENKAFEASNDSPPQRP